MSVVLLATLIVASFAGGGVYWLAGRLGAGPWVAIMLALLAYGLCLHADLAAWVR